MSEPEENQPSGFFDFVGDRAADTTPSDASTPVELTGIPPYAQRALDLALGDHPFLCQDCQEFCSEQVVALRDRIFSRAATIASWLLDTIDLYGRSRKLGISEPVDVIPRVYTAWEALADLLEVSEPQDHFTEGEES